MAIMSVMFIILMVVITLFFPSDLIIEHVMVPVECVAVPWFTISSQSVHFTLPLRS